MSNTVVQNANEASCIGIAYYEANNTVFVCDYHQSDVVAYNVSDKENPVFLSRHSLSGSAERSHGITINNKDVSSIPVIKIEGIFF